MRLALILWIPAALLFAIVETPLAVASTNYSELAVRLIDTRGDEYVEARAEALSLGENERIALLETLETSDVFGAALLAEALKLRITDPALAREFDARLKKVFETPAAMDILGRAHYYENVREFIPEDPAIAPLAFEAACKIDRSFATALMNMERSRMIEWFAALAAHPSGDGPLTYDEPRYGAMNAAIRLTGQNGPAVIPAYTKAYKTIRNRSHAADDLGFCSSLVRNINLMLGEPDQAWLAELRAFERELMPRQGLRPWLWDRAVVKQDFEAAQARVKDLEEALKKVGINVHDRIPRGDPARFKFERDAPLLDEREAARRMDAFRQAEEEAEAKRRLWTAKALWDYLSGE